MPEPTPAAPADDEPLTAADLPDELFNRSMTVDRAIHVPTMLAVPSDELEDAMKIGDLDGVDALLGFRPGDLGIAAEEEELGFVLGGKTGWLVQVSAACRGPKSPSGSRALYEGIRTLKWFHADIYEEALFQAVAWHESEPDELIWLRPDERGE